MKKKLVLITIVTMLICSFFLVACGGVKATDENSYVISIYNECYRQETNGKVVYEGVKLKESFQVIRGQMFEILDYGVEDKNDYHKYSYLSLPSDYQIIENNKLQIFPSSHDTIFVRERNLKNISLFLDGVEIYSKLTNEYKEDYNKYFKNVYTESFYISSSYVNNVLKNVKESVTLELYTNSAFLGEPFAKSTFTFRYNSGVFSGSLSFNLIKTTNVYIKVV